MTEHTDEINAVTCGDMLAVEYLSFGIDHEGFICVVFKDEHGVLESYPLNVNDETDEGVLQLLCKLSGVHPVDIGRAVAEQRRKFDALEEHS